MKNLHKFRHLFLIIFLISLSLTIYSLAIKEISKVITYICIFVDGASIVMFYAFYLGNKNIKQLEFLEKKMKLWNNISFRVKKAGEYSFTSLPVAIIVYNNHNQIEWANNYAKDVFLSPLVERQIENLSDELSRLMEKNDDFEITIYGKIYQVSVLREYNVMYLTDKTDFANLQKKYNNRTLAIGMLNIDNLDQALASLDAQEKSLQMSNLIGILSEWSNKHQIYLKGFSEEKYLLVMDYSQLLQLMQENFKILDDIKQYCTKEGLRISVSIGVSCKDITTLELVDLAEQQLEMALNRGGDQCVVMIDDNISYFGARVATFEQRSPTHVRVKAEELQELIEKSSNVLVMGHDDMDADSFASCLAVNKMALALGKESKIIFNKEKVDKTISYVYELIEKEHINILNYIVTPSEGLKLLTSNTLLIIVDCQYSNLLMDQKIYTRSRHVAVIDHHRRNSFAINDFDYIYTQPSASSTVELIVEMFDFIPIEKLELTEIEATLMLMGIIVDTNNFMYRTSSRTFIVLAKLQKYNSDMSIVRRYLREDFDDYLKKTNLLNKLEVVEGGYGIILCDDEEIYSRQFLAKIADNMISVNNIKAAFCIGRLDNKQVGISARSLDESNVQVIMEQLNGGGHFNNAATQLEDVTLAEAREMLIEKLKKIDDGGLNMKVILTKDVKGKGKANDIIDVPSGHGNFLIRSGQAIEATVDNVKELEKNQEKEKIQAEKHLEEMRELKQKIESTSVTVKVKVGKEGKMFGAVSSKQIIEEFKNQNHIELDKRKMMYDKHVEGLGTYKIPIALHKEVTATITLYVVEEK